jgi:hypothetical protein
VASAVLSVYYITVQNLCTLALVEAAPELWERACVCVCIKDDFAVKSTHLCRTSSVAAYLPSRVYFRLKGEKHQRTQFY